MSSVPETLICRIETIDEEWKALEHDWVIYIGKRSGSVAIKKKKSRTWESRKEKVVCGTGLGGQVKNVEEEERERERDLPGS